MTNTLSALLQQTQTAFQKKEYSLALGSLYKASKINKNTASTQKLLQEIQKKMLHTGQISKKIDLPQLNAPWNLMPSLLLVFLLLFMLKGLVSIYQKKKLRLTYTISFILFSAFFFYTGIKQYHFYLQPQAINLSPNIPLYLAPDIKSPVLFKIGQIKLLRIKKIQNNWAFVQVQGQAGWVRRDLLFFTNFPSIDILWEL